MVLETDTAQLVERLRGLAVRGLPKMYLADTDEFAFTRAAGTDGRLELRGTSTRYAAIVALGARGLTGADQRAVFGGRTRAEFVDLLVGRLPRVDDLGDVALICWAAADAAVESLPRAVARLRELDDPARPRYVVEVSWVLSALAAARPHVDVEVELARVRRRLLASRSAGGPLFPHATGPSAPGSGSRGLVAWYRTHVACYADQVYPIQALARLHRCGDDPEALAAATACADRICQAQGAGGQWWWHYDARTGAPVEGYPVYTVHQHAMGPMALLDLADAGGPRHDEAIQRGLRWITAPAEFEPAGGAGVEGVPMILDDEAVTWRKVYRGDPRKVVRGVRGLTTRVVPGLRLPGLDRVYRPSAVDRECRPYELGWLLFAWGGPQSPGDSSTAPATATATAATAPATATAATATATTAADASRGSVA